MLDVFIALFGGAYSVGKILADKSELKKNKFESDRRCELWTSRLHEWEAQVVDRALQEDLWYSVSSDREAAWAEVRDACTKMRFQKNYVSANDWAYDGVMDRTKAGRKMYRRHRMEEPLDIMLAKRGKLRSDIATSSIARLNRGEGQRTRQEWNRVIEFWTYIRDELRKHGVDARLLFECEHPTKKYFDVDDIEKFQYQPGKLMWLPYTWVDSNLMPI